MLGVLALEDLLQAFDRILFFLRQKIYSFLLEDIQQKEPDLLEEALIQSV